MMGRLLRRLCEDRGLALPLALLAMATTGALVVSALEFSSSSGRTANIGKGRVSAAALAEAGLANALAVLNYDPNDPTSPTLLGCDAAGTNCTPTVTAYNEGTASWYGALNGGTSTWTLTSIGQVANPTGGVALRRTLTATVPLVATAGPVNAAVWNYLYSTKTPGAGCEVSINGTGAIVDIPIYVEGDLCLSGTGAMVDERGEGQVPAPQPIDLRVGGRLVYSGTGATVGVSSDPITSAAIAGNCATTITGATQTCARPPFEWYVGAVNTFTALTAPVADYATWFAANDTINSTSTTAGQDGDCDVRSGTPPNINPDTLLDADAGTINLTPGAPYVCRKTSDGTAGGPVVAELSWDGTSVLTVKGVSVIDGAVTMNDTDGTYQGLASIYANGTFSMTGTGASMCSSSSCDFTTWNPNTEMLMMVATGITMSGSGVRWQGALFCGPTATADLTGTGGAVHGPVICGTFTFGTGVVIKPLPGITQLPLGAPADPNVTLGPGTPVYGG